MYVYLNVKKGTNEKDQIDHYTKAYPLTSCFVANKECGEEKRDRGPWNITHVPTGYKMCTVRLLSEARVVAENLESLWSGWVSNHKEWIRENAPKRARDYLKEVGISE